MPIINFRQRNSEAGQVLLLVVLVAVISLTVGLAAVGRSVTNTRVSTEESNSQKALNAAEAGLEEQIRKANQNPGDIPAAGDTLDKDLGEASSFKATVRRIQGREFVFNNGELPVSKSEGADVWLSTYPNFDNPIPNSRLTIFWNRISGASCDNPDNPQPAIEVVILSGENANPASKNDPTVNRYAIDTCNSRNNGFTKTGIDSLSNPNPNPLQDINGNSHSFNYSYQLPAVSNGYIARIIPIYADTEIGVRSNVSLPAQGFNVESEGTSGEAVRKVKVFQSFPAVPIEIFPYNLFNP